MGKKVDREGGQYPLNNLFMGAWMECNKCHKRRKSYKDFESQWTALYIDESVIVLYCPTCFGISDPARQHCEEFGHDYENGACCRCGRLYDQQM